MKIIVLGAGRVGSTIARDLDGDARFHVTVADRDPQRLAELESRWSLHGERVDFSLPSTVERAVADRDLVVSAVPGFLGHRTLRAILETGTDVVDIAFFPEDPFTLGDLARDRGATAIVDCGVAPGLSNLLVGSAVARMDAAERVAIYVGGLPADPKPPYEYRAVFSPIDVIEEYTRPARTVVDGQVVTKPALSDVEQLAFDGIGTLEAFVTDGLRTLIDTVDCPQMIEKTLRYPGHADKVRLLRDTGFFSSEPTPVDGAEIRPIDLTTALLFPLWQREPDEEDVTVLRVVVDGTEDGKGLRRTYDLVDRLDPATGITSMARTTGYTAAVVARLLAAGEIEAEGVVAPEMLASNPTTVDAILAGLRQRGIDVRERSEPSISG